MISSNDLALVALLDLDIFKYIARITYCIHNVCNWQMAI